MAQAARADGERATERSRDRFLDAAAREFIEKGYESATIRSIAARAGTSLASLTRNWTGKRELYQQVFEAHIGIVNRAQHRAFAAWEARPDAPLEELIEALLSPVLAPRGHSDEREISHLVYSQALASPSPEVRELVMPLVSGVRDEMVRLLSKCLPSPDKQRLFLAMTIINGAYVYAQQHGERLAQGIALDRDAIDWPATSSRIAAMIANGLRG